MATKTRAGARGWATRASNKLETLCQETTVDILVIKDAMEELDARIKALDAAQAAVEADVEMEDLEREINEAADFWDNVGQPLIKAAKLVAANVRQAVPTQDDTGQSSQLNGRVSTNGNNKLSCLRFSCPNLVGKS